MIQKLGFTSRTVSDVLLIVCFSALLPCCVNVETVKLVGARM